MIDHAVTSRSYVFGKLLLKIKKTSHLTLELKRKRSEDGNCMIDLSHEFAKRFLWESNLSQYYLEAELINWMLSVNSFDLKDRDVEAGFKRLKPVLRWQASPVISHTTLQWSTFSSWPRWHKHLESRAFVSSDSLLIQTGKSSAFVSWLYFFFFEGDTGGDGTNES